MAEYIIQNDVPIPAHGRTGVTKYPFSKMQVGDSFFSPTSASALYQASLHQSGKFKVKKVQENGANGARVWRVE